MHVTDISAAIDDRSLLVNNLVQHYEPALLRDVRSQPRPLCLLMTIILDFCRTWPASRVTCHTTAQVPGCDNLTCLAATCSNHLRSRFLLGTCLLTCCTIAQVPECDNVTCLAATCSNYIFAPDFSWELPSCRHTQTECYVADSLQTLASPTM